MTIDDKIRHEKLQYDINIEAAKISALSTGKTDKYEYLIGEEIIPLIKVEQQDKLRLHILVQKKLLKNKQKRLKNKKKKEK